MLENILAVLGSLGMVGGLGFALYSIYRFRVKKDITVFPIILGGAVFLVGFWLIFLLGIIAGNNEPEQATNNQAPSVFVSEDANDETVEEDAVEEEVVEEAPDPTIDEFIQKVKPGDPISNYNEYMSENDLRINRGYTAYNRQFDEVMIEGQPVVIIYDEQEVLVVDTDHELDQVKDTYIKNVQEELTTTINGSTDTGTDAIPLEKGFAVVESRYNGSSNFVVALQDSQGQMIDLLVNEIGTYSGKSFVWIEETGDYYFNINGNQGKWEIKVMQYRPLDLPTLPGDLSGTGDDVIFFEIDQGSYQLSFSHNGESNFVVFMNGYDLLVNEIGSYEGSQRYGFEESNVYVFVVKADGDWKISVKE